MRQNGSTKRAAMVFCFPAFHFFFDSFIMVRFHRRAVVATLTPISNSRIGARVSRSHYDYRRLIHRFNLKKQLHQLSSFCSREIWALTNGDDTFLLTSMTTKCLIIIIEGDEEWCGRNFYLFISSTFHNVHNKRFVPFKWPIPSSMWIADDEDRSRCRFPSSWGRSTAWVR